MKLLMFIVGVNLCINAAGQNSVNSAGGTDTTNDFIISYSIGQTFYSNDTTGSFEYFDGIQIPFEIYLTNSIEEVDTLNIGISLSAFPNPTSSIINVISQEANHKVFEIELFNFEGKRVLSKRSSLPFQLDLSEHSAATYYLRISNYESSSIIKIIKEI